MTLHWWMHWFWVTMLLVVFASINSNAAPQSEELQHITTDEQTKPERRGRAMYYTKTTLLTTSTAAPVPEHTENTTNTTELDTTTTEPYQETNKTVELSHPSIIKLTNQTLANATLTKPQNVSETEIVRLEDDTSVNKTDVDNSTPKLKNLTVEIKEVDSSIDVAESRIVSEKPLSLETSFLQTRLPPLLESSRRILDQERPNSMDTGAIAGISFGLVVLVALIGSTGLVLYRRRSGNHPQTLHDKCSNPDSSHYLDDSTVRDNSEEMYSLDNDSFLNSLEAMTIQNYWTDTVKHTKL